VRSSASRAATSPMVGGAARLSEVKSENWPCVSPTARNASSKRLNVFVKNELGPPTKTWEKSMFVQPYLNFEGRCDEALEFYKKAIGAKVGMLMRFKDAANKSMVTPGSEDKVMHSQVQPGDSSALCRTALALERRIFTASR